MYDTIHKNYDLCSLEQLQKISPLQKLNITWLVWGLIHCMSPRRWNTVRTAPKHAEYQIIELILGKITPLSKQCSPKFRYTCRRWLTGCNSSAKHVPHMLYRIQVRWECWPFHTGDILRLKVFVNNVCTVRTGVVIHKHKFCAHGTSKQTYMLFQNDVPINLGCHGSDLNMQICSGAQYNSTPNEQSCTTVMVSFNDVVLVVTGTWRSPYESPTWIRLQAKPGLVGKHHTSPLWRCPHCMFSTPS